MWNNVEQRASWSLCLRDTRERHLNAVYVLFGAVLCHRCAPALLHQQTPSPRLTQAPVILPGSDSVATMNSDFQTYQTHCLFLNDATRLQPPTKMEGYGLSSTNGPVDPSLSILPSPLLNPFFSNFRSFLLIRTSGCIINVIIVDHHPDSVVCRISTNLQNDYLSSFTSLTLLLNLQPDFHYSGL